MATYFILTGLKQDLNENHVRRAFESLNIHIIPQGSLHKLKTDCVGFFYPKPGVDVSAIDGYKFSENAEPIRYIPTTSQCYMSIKVSAKVIFILKNKKRK